MVVASEDAGAGSGSGGDSGVGWEGGGVEAGFLLVLVVVIGYIVERPSLLGTPVVFTPGIVRIYRQ